MSSPCIPAGSSSLIVAVSGGMDSSLALALSVESGRPVRACHVIMGGEVPEILARLCDRLDVELILLDAAGRFREDVVEASRKMLDRGLTPNPCAICNARVKLLEPFGLLEDDELLVTGHYCRMIDGRLHRAADLRRDQSYFLSLVPAMVLERCVFPLGNMDKRAVERELTDRNLPFDRRESMDLCFELTPSTPARPLELIDAETGQKLGLYTARSALTIGQRKGIGAHGERRYVVGMDPEKGRVLLGPAESLAVTEVGMEELNWLQDADLPFEGMLQYRSTADPVRALVRKAAHGVVCSLEQSAGAVAPGQTGAVYVDGAVVCAGTISGTGGR